jgi:hypothetical protein
MFPEKITAILVEILMTRNGKAKALPISNTIGIPIGGFGLTEWIEVVGAFIFEVGREP